MRTTDLDVSKLSVAARIQLAEDLRDSVAADTGDLPPAEARKAELERRLAHFERDPGAGEPWDVVRARIEKRLAQAGLLPASSSARPSRSRTTTRSVTMRKLKPVTPGELPREEP